MLYAARGSHDSFRQVLLRINFFFYHEPVFAPLATDVILTGLTLIFFLLLLLLLRVFARAGAIDVVLNLVAGIAALAAVPMSWLFREPTYTGIWVLALYFAVIGGALYLSRRRPNPAWFVVLLVHYSVSGYAILQTSAPGFFDWPRYLLDLPSMWPYLLSLVSPCAGLVWALYVMRTPMQPMVRVK
jgi:hypothetical protein